MSRQEIVVIPAQKTPHFTHGSVSINLLIEHPYPNLAKLSDDSPRKGLKEVKKELKTHPNDLDLLNLLTFCYLKKKRIRAANKTIKQAYEAHPDKLIAKVNYADLCLRKKRLKDVKRIFKGKYTLTELYPDRSYFSLGEFRGFMLCMGHFYLAEKQLDKAKCYYYLAYKVDPNHSGVSILKNKFVN